MDELALLRSQVSNLSATVTPLAGFVHAARASGDFSGVAPSPSEGGGDGVWCMLRRVGVYRLSLLRLVLAGTPQPLSLTCC